jgi:hypothetical protein
VIARITFHPDAEREMVQAADYYCIGAIVRDVFMPRSAVCGN